jgi:hypothetical protein
MPANNINNITTEAAGLCPAYSFVLAKKVFTNSTWFFTPIGKSLKREYFGPKKPNSILKKINVPAKAPKAKCRLWRSSASPSKYAAAKLIASNQ